MRMRYHYTYLSIQYLSINLSFDTSAKVVASFKDKNVEFNLVCFVTENEVPQAFVAGEGMAIFETVRIWYEALYIVHQLCGTNFQSMRKTLQH